MPTRQCRAKAIPQSHALGPTAKNRSHAPGNAIHHLHPCIPRHMPNSLSLTSLNTSLTSRVNNLTTLASNSSSVQNLKNSLTSQNAVCNTVVFLLPIAQRTCPAVSQSVTDILLPLTVIEPAARRGKDTFTSLARRIAASYINGVIIISTRFMQVLLCCITYWKICRRWWASVSRGTCPPRSS